MIKLFLGIIIGVLLANLFKGKAKNTHDYSELIKRCIEEANKDLSNCGKKKTFK